MAVQVENRPTGRLGSLVEKPAADVLEQLVGARQRHREVCIVILHRGSGRIRELDRRRVSHDRIGHDAIGIRIALADRVDVLGSRRVRRTDVDDLRGGPARGENLRPERLPLGEFGRRPAPVEAEDLAARNRLRDRGRDVGLRVFRAANDGRNVLHRDLGGQLRDFSLVRDPDRDRFRDRLVAGGEDVVVGRSAAHADERRAAEDEAAGRTGRRDGAGLPCERRALRIPDDVDEIRAVVVHDDLGRIDVDRRELRRVGGAGGGDRGERVGRTIGRRSVAPTREGVDRRGRGGLGRGRALPGRRRADCVDFGRLDVLHDPDDGRLRKDLVCGLSVDWFFRLLDVPRGRVVRVDRGIHCDGAVMVRAGVADRDERRGGVARFGMDKRDRVGAVDDELPVVACVERGRRAGGNGDAAQEAGRRLAHGLDRHAVGERRGAVDVERPCFGAVLVARERDVAEDREVGADRQRAGGVGVEEREVVHAERAGAGRRNAVVAPEDQMDGAVVALALVGADERDGGVGHESLAVVGVAVDADRAVVREGDDRRLRRDVADVPVGRVVPVAGRAADPGGRREAGRGVGRDERDVGRRRNREVVVGVVELPCVEHIDDRVVAGLRRVGGGGRHESAGRDALSLGGGGAAVGVERHVVAGLDDPVAVAVIDGDVAGGREVGAGALGLVVLRVEADERAAGDRDAGGARRVGGVHAVEREVGAVGIGERRQREGAAVDLDRAELGLDDRAAAVVGAALDRQLGAFAHIEGVDAANAAVGIRSGLVEAVDAARRRLDRRVGVDVESRPVARGLKFAGHRQRAGAEVDRDRLGDHDAIRRRRLGRGNRVVRQQQDRGVRRRRGDGFGEGGVGADRIRCDDAFVLGDGEDRRLGRDAIVVDGRDGHGARERRGQLCGPAGERVDLAVLDIGGRIERNRDVGHRRAVLVVRSGGVLVPREGHRIGVDLHRGSGHVERVVVLHDAGGDLERDRLVAGGGDVPARFGREGHVNGRAGIDFEERAAAIDRAGQRLASGHGRHGRVGDGGDGERDGRALPDRGVGAIADAARRDRDGRVGRVHARAEPADEVVVRLGRGGEREGRRRDRVGIGGLVAGGPGAGVQLVGDGVDDGVDRVGRHVARDARDDLVAGGGGDDGLGRGEGTLRRVDLDGLVDGEGDRAGDAVREEVEGLRAGLVGGGEAVRGGGVGRVAHGGLEGHVVFGDDGGDDALRVGEADALDGGIARLHR